MEQQGAGRRDVTSPRHVNGLIATATELFYQDGIRAIGIDAVLAKSGVAKSTLYRTFASKDELIAAVAAEQNHGSGNGGMCCEQELRFASPADRGVVRRPGRTNFASPPSADVPSSTWQPSSPTVPIQPPQSPAATSRQYAKASGR